MKGFLAVMALSAAMLPMFSGNAMADSRGNYNRDGHGWSDDRGGRHDEWRDRHHDKHHNNFWHRSHMFYKPMPLPPPRLVYYGPAPRQQVVIATPTAGFYYYAPAYR